VKPGLDIVIVNWNAGALLAQCLGSIPTALDACFALESVTVVDNGSSDASLEGLDGLPLPLRLLRNTENLGFGRASNQGAWLGRAPYLLFLNPDTRLLAGSLALPIEHLERPENRRVGVAGIRLLDVEGKTSTSCARFPRSAAFLASAAGLDRLGGLGSLGYRMADFDHETSRDVDHVMGAYYLVRRELFARLGGFDERFFVYFEDLDLSRRVAESGSLVRFLAEARAFHAGGGTTRQVRSRRLAYYLRGKLRYAHKHLGTPGAFLVGAATLLVEPWTRSLGALLRLSPGELCATLGAYGLLLHAEPRRHA
jgi:hypothetical protein